MQRLTTVLFLVCLWNNALRRAASRDACLATDEPCETSSGGASSFMSYTGTMKACSDVSDTTIIPRRHLYTAKAQSPQLCLQHCYREGLCEIAVYSNNKDCHLLTAIEEYDTNKVYIGDPSCQVIYLNLGLHACQNGGFLEHGHCQCRGGYTGQYCELSNPERCSRSYVPIHSTTSSTGGIEILQNGINFLKELGSPSVKVSFVKDSASDRETGPADFEGYNDASNSWVAEVHGIVSKSDRSQYKTVPYTIMYMLTSTGMLAEGNLNFTGLTIGTSKRAVDETKIIARFPSDEYIVMGSVAGGTVDDVLTAISRGFEIVSSHAVTFDMGSPASVVQHRVGVKAGKNGNEESRIMIEEPICYTSQKMDGQGISSQEKNCMNGKRAYEVKSEQRDFVFDPCWFEVTQNMRSNQKSIKYLKHAIGNGKRARVVFDGVSAKTVATYVIGNNVFFQVSAYLSRKESVTIDSSSEVVHSVVSTGGNVTTCVHPMMVSKATSQDTYVANDVRWFVDSRNWELLLETDTVGESASGDMGSLKYYIEHGHDIQVVVETETMLYSFPGAWMMTSTTMADLTISAEIKNVLRLDLSTGGDFSFSDKDHCTLNNYLISTNKGWEIMEYSYGSQSKPPALRNSWEAGTVKWYVSPPHE